MSLLPYTSESFTVMIFKTAESEVMLIFKVELDNIKQ